MSLIENNLMTLTAKSLKDNNPEIGFLRGEVRRHIKEIEFNIREATKQKKTQILYEIEQNFAVTKLSNKVAQRFVYSGIIDQLQLNGFEVKFFMDNRFYFIVSWETDIERKEITRQNIIIQMALNKRSDT